MKKVTLGVGKLEQVYLRVSVKPCGIERGVSGIDVLSYTTKRRNNNKSSSSNNDNIDNNNNNNNYYYYYYYYYYY